MKAACIIYHANIDKLYPAHWMQEMVQSIERQTVQADIVELNYGKCDRQYTTGTFISKEMPNHIHAINYLITDCFKKGYDVVFNTNCDDVYDIHRFEYQLEAIERGYQLVSSNMRYMNGRVFVFSKMDMQKELARGHNIIAHPVVAMHSSFWSDGMRYDENELGYEDFTLWKKALSMGKKFYICDDILLHYRLHSNQVGRVNKAAWSVS